MITLPGAAAMAASGRVGAARSAGRHCAVGVAGNEGEPERCDAQRTCRRGEHRCGKGAGRRGRPASDAREATSSEAVKLAGATRTANR